MIWGPRPRNAAVASTVAEPVSWVSHQIKANCTAWLPTRESDCPENRIQKGLMELVVVFMVTFS